jgi:hypothetical protein
MAALQQFVVRHWLLTHSPLAVHAVPSVSLTRQLVPLR